MGASFVERLGGAILSGAAPACVGLDPRVDALPQALEPSAGPGSRILAFHREVIPRLAGRVPAVKPNIAFYEQHGADGLAAYVETCRLAKDHGLLVIGDVKRGDVGSTAEAYARFHLDVADAVTLHPYLGSDAIQPFLRRCGDEGRAVFVLVRTSNAGAAELQDLATPDGSVAAVVAAAVDRLGADTATAHGYTSAGAVVGATRPDLLAELRARMPRAWLLIPGVGAQGGRVADLAPAFDRRGLGALVNQSRGILQCFAPADAQWRDRIDAALADFVADLHGVAVPDHPLP